MGIPGSTGAPADVIGMAIGTIGATGGGMGGRSILLEPIPWSYAHTYMTRNPLKRQQTQASMIHAIFSTPWPRRRETLGMATWLYAPIISILITFLCLKFYTHFWPLITIYIIWFLYDRERPFTATMKPLKFMIRDWRPMRAYFPITLQPLTCNLKLDATKQYMFGYHPHGIFGLGAVMNFALDRGPLDALCMNGHLKLKLLTVDFNFYIPIWREFCIASGLAGVGRSSVECLLNNGHSVAIVVGGARESLEAHPGTTKLILRKRRGFFRLALQHGCSVVPVFGFGENNVYNLMERPIDSMISRIQDRLIHIFGFTLPLFNGRGMFNYSRGLLPRRHAIHAVIGDPIDAGPPRPAPTDQDIDALQTKYICELQRIYDEYKEPYMPSRRSSLTIIQ